MRRHATERPTLSAYRRPERSTATLLTRQRLSGRGGIPAVTVSDPDSAGASGLRSGERRPRPTRAGAHPPARGWVPGLAVEQIR